MGIVLFNPRRGLTPSSLSPPKKPLVSGPTTPRTTRIARSTSKVALNLIKGGSNSPTKLRTLIRQLDKGLQISIPEREIGDHISSQFRKSIAKRGGKASTTNRKQLSKARIITTEEVIRLRKVRETADVAKTAKTLAEEQKKKAKESQGSSVPKTKGKSRKKVTIAENITIHVIESDTEKVDNEWANIDDFYSSVLGRSIKK